MDVAQDAVIKEIDCETKKGVVVETIVESGNITSDLIERVLGRSPLEDIMDQTGKVIVPQGKLIEETHIEKIKLLN